LDDAPIARRTSHPKRGSWISDSECEHSASGECVPEHPLALDHGRAPRPLPHRTRTCSQRRKTVRSSRVWIPIGPGWPCSQRLFGAAHSRWLTHQIVTGHCPSPRIRREGWSSRRPLVQPMDELSGEQSPSETGSHSSGARSAVIVLPCAEAVKAVAPCEREGKVAGNHHRHAWWDCQRIIVAQSPSTSPPERQLHK
jgi:hypothetical protein